MRKFPPYPARPHPGSGQARIKLDGRHVYLGVFGTDASWAEYQRRLSEWRAAGASSPDFPTLPQSFAPARTVADLVAAYLEHLEREAARKQDDRELKNHRFALAPLIRLLGHTPISDLRPKALRAALAAAAAGTWLTAEERARRQAGGRKCTWSRPHARRALGRWKAAVKWAESEELVPGGTLQQVAAARALDEGQAEERPDVPPAPEESIKKALPKLHRILRALVECLLLTGARPGELCKLTPGDLNRSGEVELAKGYRVKLGKGVWAYQPLKWKGAWRGHRRVILFGPRAQAVLAPLLEGRPDGCPVFCPREASNRPLTGGKPPKERYDRHALRQALERACRRAGVEPFTSYQLRHNAATRLAEEFGPEVARIVLGHRDLRVTQIYVLDSLGKAAEAMERAG